MGNQGRQWNVFLITSEQGGALNIILSGWYLVDRWVHSIINLGSNRLLSSVVIHRVTWWLSYSWSRGTKIKLTIWQVKVNCMESATGNLSTYNIRRKLSNNYLEHDELSHQGLAWETGDRLNKLPDNMACSVPWLYEVRTNFELILFSAIYKFVVMITAWVILAVIYFC